MTRQINIRWSDFLPPLLVRSLAILKGRLPIFFPSPPPELPRFMHERLHSYSQYHEDLLIDLILGQKPTGFYVDIGANDPLLNSNTRRFYNRGWRGINVEPGIGGFKRLVSSRPRDHNINVAVADKPGSLKFYDVIGDSTLSSLDSDTARRMARLHGHRVAPTSMQVTTLRDILERVQLETSIDFLSVDAEGYDLRVLRGNDWSRFRPTLVLVEMNLAPDEINEYMRSVNYVLVFSNSFNGLFMDGAKFEALPVRADDTATVPCTTAVARSVSTAS